VNRITWIALMALVMALSNVQGQPATTLESLCATYDSAVTKIADDTQRQKDDALTQYGTTLDSLQASFKQKADFTAFMAVNAEKKRFQSDKSVLAKEPNAYVADAVAAYHKQMSGADSDSHRRKIDLLTKYIGALNRLGKDLTTRGKSDDAKAVEDVKQAAKVTLAEIDPRHPIQEDASAVNIDSVKGNSEAKATDNPFKKAVPSDAVEFNGHHYKVFSDTSYWDKAQFRCRTQGGHLVVIENGDENDFVYELMKDSASAWIGASKDLGDWHWVTTKPFAYQNWTNRKPRGKTLRANRTIGSGMKAAMYGIQENPYEPLERHWFAQSTDDSGNIPAYVCEWDY